MKPDKTTCNNCGKQIQKGKWCSDRCRKAYARKTDMEPGQKADKINPDTDVLLPGQPTRTNGFRDSLTKTDKTFYDRAMRDFGEPYYNFSDEVKDETCILKSCSGKFKTSLNLLRYCSYQHYSDALSGRK